MRFPFLFFTSIVFALVSITSSGGVMALDKAQKIDKTVLASAKNAVKSILKDPDSAKFYNIKANKDGDICGLYNAKNSYGGYGESEYFMYVKKTGELLNMKMIQLKNEADDLNHKLNTLGAYSQPLEDKLKDMRNKYRTVETQIVGCEPQ